MRPKNSNFNPKYLHELQFRYNIEFFPQDLLYNLLRFEVTGHDLHGWVDYGSFDIKEWWIFIDRAGLFDKYSKCPIQLRFPANEKQLKFLLAKMRWLETKEAYRISQYQEEELWITDYRL